MMHGGRTSHLAATEYLFPTNGKSGDTEMVTSQLQGFINLKGMAHKDRNTKILASEWRFMILFATVDRLHKACVKSKEQD